MLNQHKQYQSSDIIEYLEEEFPEFKFVMCQLNDYDFVSIVQQYDRKLSPPIITTVSIITYPVSENDIPYLGKMVHDNITINKRHNNLNNDIFMEKNY